MTQLEVIKEFMASLDEGVEDGVTALNDAVKACSNFKSAQAAINQMVKDCKKAGNWQTFLEESCGIFLNNEDTGAITGFDAGGDDIKSAEDIVPEEGKAVYPKKNSFTKDGLTFKTPKPSSLTGDKKTTLQGIYSWWAEESLNLIEESFGYSFNDDDVYSDKIELKFYSDKNDSALAYVHSALEDDKLDLELYVNMGIFKNLVKNNKNGKAKNEDEYLDRTLVHEFTHAIMAAKVDSYYDLPVSITEGLAELVHGIDDERYKRIKDLAGDSKKLKKYLDLKKDESTDGYDYAAGYMFLRYLAHQAADEVPLINYDNEQIITGTKYKDIVKNFGTDVSINGGKGNDELSTYYSYDYTDYWEEESEEFFVKEVTLNGGNGNDTLYGSSDNVYFIGGAGTDSIFSYSDNATIYGGKGNDKIELNTDYEVKNNIIRYASGDGKDIVYGFDSDDKIKITKGSYKLTTKGNDVIVKVGKGSITLKDAANEDISIINSKGKTKTYSTSRKTSEALFVADENNFSADIDSIMKNNFAATDYKLETNNFDSLTTENNLITYSDKK